MKYSTKIKIAVGIGFAFIVIMALVMIIFVSTRGSSSEDSSSQTETKTSSNVETTNSEDGEDGEYSSNISLSNIVSLGIVDRDGAMYLAKINDDLEIETFTNLSEDENLSFIDYDYSNGKAYVLYDLGNCIQIYSIDLEDYEEELVVEFDNEDETTFGFYGENSFFVNDEKIYFAISNCIYEYDIEDYALLSIVSLEENETLASFQMNKDNNQIYYMKNVYQDESYNSVICKLSIDNVTEIDEFLNIDVEGNEILLNDNYLVFSVFNYDENSNEYSINYFYNVQTKVYWGLGSNSSIRDTYGNVTFVDGYIIFSNGESIIFKDYEGSSVYDDLEICEDGEEILDIYMLTTDKLQIRISEDGSTVSKTYIYDFTYDTLEETEENYYNVLNLR